MVSCDYGHWTSHFPFVKSFGDLVFAQGEGDVRSGSGGVVRSSDGGNTWQLAIRLNNVNDIGQIGSNVFVSASYNFLNGISDTLFELYESTDYGISWDTVYELLPNRKLFGFTCFLTYDKTIFAGASVPGGLFFSIDSGKSWTAENIKGIPTSPDSGLSLIHI